MLAGGHRRDERGDLHGALTGYSNTTCSTQERRRVVCLCCEGQLDGNAGCPRGFRVNVEDKNNWPMLDQLHLDHRYDLKVICDAWKGALPLSKKKNCRQMSVDVSGFGVKVFC